MHNDLLEDAGAPSEVNAEILKSGSAQTQAAAASDAGIDHIVPSKLPLLAFPFEILRELLSFLDVISLVQCSRVSLCL
jgi:hypothetical protein